MSLESNWAEVEQVTENKDNATEEFKLQLVPARSASILSKQSKTNERKTCNELRKCPKTTKPDSTGKILARSAATDKNTTGGGDQIRMVQPNQKSKIPGWLISDLDAEPTLMNLLSVKAILKTMKACPAQMIEQLYELMTTYLRIEVTLNEIQSVLLAITWNFEEGPSFLQFMLYMANFEAAKKMYIKMAWKSSYKPLEGTTQKMKSGKHDEGSKTKQSKKGSKKTNLVKKYSRSEKIFYTGIFIFETHSSLQCLDDLYGNSMSKPLLTEQKLKKVPNSDRDTLGIKKKGSVAWDKPLQPVPEISPYASPMHFRIPSIVEKPKVVDRKKKPAETQNPPKHLMIETPRDKDDTIQIIENRKTIRVAVKSLAENGFCVSLLPEVQEINNLSDSIVDKLGNWTLNLDAKLKLEEKKFAKELAILLKAKSLIVPESTVADLAWIDSKAKSLYHRQGLPTELTTMKPLIKYTDGLNLRTLCEHIQKDHWSDLSRQELEFRDSAWEKMHVDRIPDGGLRDSFVHTFINYLPYFPHLPIVHDKNSNPY